MTTPAMQRGGAPVGYVTDLEPVEAGAVLYLRLWCDGPDAQIRVQSDFRQNLGARQGSQALQSLEQLCTLCVRHGRRPLMRHQVNCKCLGADESCFANFVAAASEGAHEDAMLMATLMVRADMAPCLVGLAQTVGLALRRMCLHETMPPRQTAPISTTLH